MASTSRTACRWRPNWNTSGMPGRRPVCCAARWKSAALFVVSAVLGLRAGALFAVLWNQERRQAGLSDPHCMDTTIAIEGAVEGLKCLIMRDTAE